MVGGRWVRDQEVDIVQLADDVYKISWTEPTGTSVCVTAMPGQRRTHGTIFFPRWVHEHPERTVCFQNDHLEEMERYRQEGPTYPIFLVTEAATITFLEDAGQDDETLVSVAPGDLPPGYAARRN
jgi:phenolic acid decarboxylase